MALTDVQANTHEAFADSCAVALYVGGAMDIQVDILVDNSINSSGSLAFDVVESQKPSHATVFAAGDAKVAYVNNTEVCVWGSLGERTFLKRKGSKQFIRCIDVVNISFVVFRLPVQS